MFWLSLHLHGIQMTEECSVCTFSLEPPSTNRFVLTILLISLNDSFAYSDDNNVAKCYLLSAGFQKKSCVCD